MADITLIPSAKVPLVYPEESTMTTEWYRFFWNIYGFTGTGVVPVSKGGTGLNTIGNHQLIIGNANNVFEPALLRGFGINVTYDPGFVNLSIGDSGVTPGTYGSASQVGVFTVNQYGVLTAASNTSIAINASQIVSGTLAVVRGGTGQSTYTDGELLIGNSTGNTLTKTTLTAGTGISVTNGAGSITIGNTGVLSVSGTAPVVSSGGATPAISMAAANTTTNGYLTSTDWNTFNNKAPATSGTSILYGNGTGGFSNVTIGSGISFVGGTLSTTGSGGTVTSVTGTSPVVSSGGTTPAISLATAYGDTLNPYASKTANYFLAAPNGSAGVPTFRAMVAADVPALAYVTSVSGTGTVNGITLTGTVTSSGSLTLGGTLSGIGNSQLTNSTISGVALGGSLFNLTAGTGVSFSAGTTYNGSTAITINATGTGGTVTSVAALTLGTTGTDLSSTVTNSTTTPVITLNVPTASAVNRGALSAADWTTFNNKAPAFTYTTNYIPYGQGTTTPTQSVGLQYNGTTFTTTGISTSNNLAFTGTGNRITGDMSNGTLTNRVAFQNSVVNGNTVIQFIPNGTGTTSQINLESDSAIANGTVLSFSTNNAGSATAGISAGIRGTGTYLPFTIYTGGSERLRVSTTGNTSFGTTVTTNARLMSALVGGSIFDRAASFGTGNLTTNYQLVSIGNNNTSTTNGIGANDTFLIAEAGGVFGTRNFGIGNATNLDLYFVTNSTEKLRLFASGGLSLGNTTDPGASNLSVTGSVNIGGTGTPVTKVLITVAPASGADNGMRVTDNTRIIQTNITGSAYSYIGIGASETMLYSTGNPLNIVSDGQPIKFIAGTAEKARIFTSGGVSIGNTTDPGAGKINASNGWAGTTSSAGRIGGTVMSFSCERNAAGSVGGIMAFGNGVAAGKGLRMPFAGKIYALTLSGTSVNGTLTVQLAVNGTGNASYQLTQTNGSAGDVGQTGNYLSSPLSFAAGDTIGVYQAAVPTSATGYFASFYVAFD